MKRALKAVKYLMLASGVSAPAFAQTVINGDALALQSSGVATTGSGWTLSENGYVGTYIDLTSAAPVTFTVNASGAASGGLNPDMTISIANSNESFDVSSSSPTNYTYTTPTLAAGTYFVRTQLDNQNATQTPDLTVGSLSVSGTGVTVLNSNTNTNALNAATTYADNYRSGPATIQLTNGNGSALGAGTQVQVTLASNAFNFAGAVSGISPYDDPSTWLNDENGSGAVTPYSNTPNTTTEIAYQKAILSSFNMIVPNNAGKWVNNEYTQGQQNMNLVDAMTDFAVQNGLGVRMHNGFWSTEQPSYISNMFAANGTFTGNLATLESDMNYRLNYYISGDSGSLGTPRTDSYQQMDLFNELWHSQADQVNYLGALGYQGVANYYANAAAEIAAAGGSTQLMTNEYNVLQFSPASISSTGVASGSDNYANWYLQGIQQIQNDGGPVSGVGMELYINPNTRADPTEDQISPAEMEQAMQNLSVDKTLNGTPASLALTEFGVASGSPNMTDYINDLTEALTMMYGTPQATTFGYWGGVGGPDANSYSLYNSTINATTDTYGLTAVGQAYEDWMSQWETNETLTTNADGQISFNGTYGLYDVTVDGVVYELDLVPGTTDYGLMTPISGATWDGNGANGNWSNSSNWTGALTANAPLVFAGTTSLNPVNDSTAGTAFESITFNSGAGPFTISGNAIGLTGNIINNSSNTQTINFNIALQANATFDAASGNLTVGGAISGAYGLTVSGPNSVTLGGANSYSGGTTVGSGSTLVATGAGSLPAGLGVVNDGTLNILANQAIGAAGVTALTGNGALNIANGAILQLATNSGAATQGGLTIAANSALDITNNHLILSDPGGSIDATIESYLAAGYNGGNWNGTSVTTGVIISSAITPGSTTYGIGWADGANGGISGITSGQLEIRYTLYGDTNLDGTVNSVDFGTLAANFGTSGPNIGWAQGAFTYNNMVNSVDFGLLASNFGKSLGGAGDVVTTADWAALYAFAEANGLMNEVPEPASGGLILLSLVGTVGLRKRRSASR